MKSIRVLIVDDLPQVRLGLSSVLLLAATRVQPVIEVVGEAQNGCEAVWQVQTIRPDVVLMDLEMPIMDGYEATRRIKAEQPDTRVIILSIHAGLEEEARARAAGADDFIVKGASYQILLNAILAGDESHHSFDNENGEKT